MGPRQLSLWLKLILFPAPAPLCPQKSHKNRVQDPIIIRAGSTTLVAAQGYVLYGPTQRPFKGNIRPNRWLSALASCLCEVLMKLRLHVVSR